MKRIGLFLWTLATATALWAGEEKDLQLASPDGTHRIAFWQKTVSPGVNELCYRVDYKGKRCSVSRVPDSIWTTVCGKWRLANVA